MCLKTFIIAAIRINGSCNYFLKLVCALKMFKSHILQSTILTTTLLHMSASTTTSHISPPTQNPVCHYCYLSAASSINKTAEAYSKVNRMLFNHLSNYHYLLTKKKLLKFYIHAVTLPGTLTMAHYLLQRLHVHFQTS